MKESSDTQMAITTIHPVDVTVSSALKYIQDEEKTNYGEFVYGHNCDVFFANEEMELTRKKFGKGTGRKNDKHKSFHLIQSFENNEALSPETVHQIGIELAEKMFPKFEVVLATHTNTSHLHNHFIINAVSFEDGKKYYDCDKTKQEIRSISDQLCEKYHLNVLEKHRKFKRNFAAERHEFTGLKKTDYRNTDMYSDWKQEHINQKEMIRNDIDVSIRSSNDFSEFIENLELIGYEVKYENVKHIAFKAPGTERYRRGIALGEEYTKENIMNRINIHQLSRELELDQENEEVVFEYENEYNKIHEEVENEISRHKNGQWNQDKNYKSFVAVLRKADNELKKLYKEKSKVNYDRNSDLSYREQKIVKSITDTIKNMHTLTNHNITSIDRLESKISEQKSRIDKMAIQLEQVKEMISERDKMIGVFVDYQELLALQKTDKLTENDEKKLEKLEGYVKSVSMNVDRQNRFMKETEDAKEEVKRLELKYRDISELYVSFTQLKDALVQMNNQERENVHMRTGREEREER